MKHFLALLLVLLNLPGAGLAAPNTPKTFDLYLRNYFDPQAIQTLAKFDAIGLDADVAVTPEYSTVLSQIRALNPSIKILAYIPINGTYNTAGSFTNPNSNWKKMYDYAELDPQSRWLWSEDGHHILDWPGKYSINLTFNCALQHTRDAQARLVAPACPGSETSKLNWYVNFILHDVLQDGQTAWDGVILDDVWVGVSFVNSDTSLNPSAIDYDRDGIADPPATLDPLWKNGNRWISGEIRRLMDANPLLQSKILIGNGGNDFYNVMNGAYMENFPFNGLLDPAPNPFNYSWADKMFGNYGYSNNETNYLNSPLRLNVLNTKWSSQPPSRPTRNFEYLQRLRFTLASSMLRDGYYSMESHSHDAIWWEPEFEKQIGTPTGAAYQVTYAGTLLWRRDFSNGAVIINNSATLFPGSVADRLPPIPAFDAAILLNSEFWSSSPTAPPPVVDLNMFKTTTSSVELGWSNVFCPDNAAIGQCSTVEIRYSNNAINDANWDSATPAGSAVPEGPQAGALQHFTVSGLNPNTSYYFAIKTKSFSSVWSGVSNNVNASTVLSDSVPPSAISDLAFVSATSNTATINWTATGDDGVSGTASSYDLRYWTAGGSYASGAQVVGEPAPAAPGTRQSITLYGLTPNQTYYAALRAADEMPNWSSASNTLTFQTAAGDTTPPAAIQDLRVASTGTGAVLLTWTASGDDGLLGRATSYDLRYRSHTAGAPDEINASNFSSSNYVTNEPGPAVVGTEQSLLLTGLGANGYSYTFAIKVCDEANNCSALSNVVAATTVQNGDVSAPAAITDLRVTSVSGTSIILSWTAPGDDGSLGQAANYDVRMLNVPLTGSNFALAQRLSGAPSPAAPGATQSLIVSGLTPNTRYYFLMRTSDEVPVWSALSNSVSALTSADSVAPMAPGALRVH